MRPDVDEAELKAEFHAVLARRNSRPIWPTAKAFSVSRTTSRSLVIGADQVLNFEGKAHDKPASPEKRAGSFCRFAGRPMRSKRRSAAARRARVVWQHAVQADLTMRNFSDAFLDDYLEQSG